VNWWTKWIGSGTGDIGIESTGTTIDVYKEWADKFKYTSSSEALRQKHAIDQQKYYQQMMQHQQLGMSPQQPVDWVLNEDQMLLRFALARMQDWETRTKQKSELSKLYELQKGFIGVAPKPIDAGEWGTITTTSPDYYTTGGLVGTTTSSETTENIKFDKYMIEWLNAKSQ
jgi:hypothetical protein